MTFVIIYISSVDYTIILKESMQKFKIHKTLIRLCV